MSIEVASVSKRFGDFIALEHQQWVYVEPRHARAFAEVGRG